MVTCQEGPANEHCDRAVRMRACDLISALGGVGGRPAGSAAHVPIQIRRDARMAPLRLRIP